MTQQNVRGCYMNFEHDRAADWDWLAKWQPNVVRLMVQGKIDDPNSVSMTRVKRVHDIVPNAIILLRCWDVDDNNFKAHDAMVANPRAEAERQVDWWAKVFDRAVAAGIPRTLLMAGLNNETGPEKDAALYTYSEAALEFGTQKAVRLGVFVFSVGRPSLPGEATHTIDTFRQLDNAIRANNGAVVLHEYMQPEGMYAVWTDDQGNERKDYTYLIGRHLRWAIQSPIIIAEWGIDGILYNRHPDPEHGNSGWRNFSQDWPPQRYADEYVECVRKSSPNVIGICPFISDPSDDKWFSFDPLEAYGALIARKDLCVRDDATTPPTEPPTTPPGNIHTGVVTAPAGLNVRSGPSAEATKLGALAAGSTVLYDSEDNGWLHLVPGYVSAEYVGEPSQQTVHIPTVGTGTPSTPEDNWTRSREFVKRWEGGYQNNPNDIGNWTGCAVGVGINKGTKFGISACAYPELDIVNLTMQQADAIYFRDYWQASGADKMAWPYCLIVFDTSVLHGVGAAQTWLDEVGANPYAFVSKRLRVYTNSANWSNFGAGWVNRVADLLLEASK